MISQRKGESLWQRKYYEHIIRNEGALNHILRYIQEKPNQWSYDSQNPDRASQ